MTNKNPTPLDLNKVDEQTLVQRLKITPRLARRILAFRPYQSVEQLNKVWGIDPETLQRILASVTVQLETPLALQSPQILPATPILTEEIVSKQETQAPLVKEIEEETPSQSTTETPEVSIPSPKPTHPGK